MEIISSDDGKWNRIESNKMKVKMQSTNIRCAQRSQKKTFLVRKNGSWAVDARNGPRAVKKGNGSNGRSFHGSAHIDSIWRCMSFVNDDVVGHYNGTDANIATATGNSFIQCLHIIFLFSVSFCSHPWICHAYFLTHTHTQQTHIWTPFFSN